MMVRATEIFVPIAEIVAVFIAMNLLTICVHHFAYRKSLMNLSRAEVVFLVPSVWPTLMLVWWALGFYTNGLSVAANSSHYWVWWMPVGALLVLVFGIWFARWNLARVVRKQSFKP